MEWYFIVLIVFGGILLLCGLYLIFALVIARATIKNALTPVAHTHAEARERQQQYEKQDFTDYDNNWNKVPFELDGVQGKLRGEVIYNDTMPQGERPKVAVICHGHTWNRINSIKYVDIFYAKGYNVVIYDHAYFGLSEGTHTTIGYKESHDLNTVLSYTRKLFGEQAILALHGESMGAATVLLELGLRSDIDFVIADCPFSKTMDYYRELCSHLHIPSFPIVDLSNVLAKRRYGYDFTKVNPIDAVKESNTPICFIHGKADKFISPHHSEDMYRVCSNRLCELHLFDGAGHARSHKADKAGYVAVMSAFIDKIEVSLGYSN